MSNKKDDLDLLVSLISLGLTTALKNNSIDNDEAQMMLFSPRVMILLSELNFPKELVHLIHLGTELEDVKDNINDRYDFYCNELTENILTYINNHRKIKSPPYFIEELIKTKE